MADLMIRDLRDALAQIERAAPGIVTKSPRASLLKVIAFLDEHPDKTVAEAAAALEALKPPPKPSKTTATRTKKPKLPMQIDVVEKYVSLLRSAEETLSGFEAAIAALRADKAARLDEVKAIVSQYSGDSSAIKSKIVGFNVIQRAFDQRWNFRQHANGLTVNSRPA